MDKIDIKCLRCGRHSFRYSKKDNKSYCLTCGAEIRPEDFEIQKKGEPNEML